jgi:pimeloyl-ACP methyl ester carboxylesterase
MIGWQEHTIDLDGRVRVVDYGGAGPRTFVCVHGLGGWALDWQLLAPQLTDSGRVLALDLPGFGESPLEGRLGSIDAQQHLLNRYLEQHYLGQPVTLIGNSMGGMISLLQAARNPAVVARLVLVSPVLPASIRRRPHPLVTAQFLLYALPQVGEWYVRARREYIDHRMLVDGSFAFLAARAEQIPRAVYQQRYELIERRAADSDQAFLAAARSLLMLLADPVTYRRMIAQVAAPALVVHGADDRLVSARSALHLARSRPDWSVNVLPEVGHIAQLEAPHQVAALIKRWLGDGASKSAGPEGVEASERH